MDEYINFWNIFLGIIIFVGVIYVFRKLTIKFLIYIRSDLEYCPRCGTLCQAHSYDMLKRFYFRCPVCEHEFSESGF